MDTHDADTEQVAPMQPGVFQRLNRRSITISIPVDGLVRWSLLVGGYSLLVAGYVLIGFADTRRGQE